MMMERSGMTHESKNHKNRLLVGVDDGFFLLHHIDGYQGKSMTQSKPIEQVKVEDLERPQVIQSVLDDEEKPQLSCL